MCELQCRTSQFQAPDSGLPWLLDSRLQSPTLHCHANGDFQVLPWETWHFWGMRLVFVVRWEIWVITGFLFIVLSTPFITMETFHGSRQSKCSSQKGLLHGLKKIHLPPCPQGLELRQTFPAVKREINAAALTSKNSF